MTVTEDFSRQDVADKLGISLGQVDKLFSKMNDLWEDYLGRDREKAAKAKTELNAIFKEFEDARVEGVGVWTSVMEDEIDSLVDYIARSFVEGEPDITTAVNRSLTPATEAAEGLSTALGFPNAISYAEFEAEMLKIGISAEDAEIVFKEAMAGNEEAVKALQTLLVEVDNLGFEELTGEINYLPTTFEEASRKLKEILAGIKGNIEGEENVPRLRGLVPSLRWC